MHNRQIILIGLLALTAVPTLAQERVGPRETPPAFAPFAQVETHRIRIVNAVNGPIQVSDDEGHNWTLVGNVVAPATQSLMGYLASGYAPQSTIAATAVHGIRIRVGDMDSAYPKLINILPREFSQTPVRFGGHISGASGIYTNIPVGQGIFRELSPLPTNPVYLTNEDNELTPLPIDYLPRENDIFTIVVRRPVNPLKEVVFENKVGGSVTATWQDGTKRRITTVLKPVSGIGRFDGTSYTGVGAINTNHTGVITVSSAPVTTSKLLEGVGVERRGGFQIEPSYHNSQSEEAGASIILVVGSLNKTRVPDLEGTPPLFNGYFDLAWDPKDLRHSWRAEVKRTSAPDKWVTMPSIVGSRPHAIADVTAIRLIRDDPGDAIWRRRRIIENAKLYLKRERLLAASGKIPVQHGTLTITPVTRDPQINYFTYYIDSAFKGLTNNKPFSFTWDTTNSPDGEYIIEARGKNSEDATVSVERTRIWVDNTRTLYQSPAPS